MEIQTPDTIDLRKYIEPRFFGDDPPIERPHIRGRRIPVATVAHSYHHHGWTVSETMYQFTLSQEQVLAALLYYSENKDIIEAQEVQYQAKLDEMYELYGRKD
jgi:uncharacterized protein (DUF433 family)